MQFNLQMNANGVLICGSFIIHACPSDGNKQSIHFVSFSAGHMRSRPSAGHTTIYITHLYPNILCTHSILLKLQAKLMSINCNATKAYKNLI